MPKDSFGIGWKKKLRWIAFFLFFIKSQIYRTQYMYNDIIRIIYTLMLMELMLKMAKHKSTEKLALKLIC